MSDRILGGGSIALAAFFVWQATLIELSFLSDPVGPKTFPIIIAAVLGLSGVAVILRPDAPAAWPALGRLLEIAVTAGVLCAYALSLPQVGFLLATAVAAAFLSWRLGAAPLSAVAAGVAISVGIYVVFHLILGLSLARGPWGF